MNKITNYKTDNPSLPVCNEPITLPVDGKDKTNFTKLIPAPTRGTQSHQSSIFSNFEALDLSSISINFELVILFLRVEL